MKNITNYTFGNLAGLDFAPLKTSSRNKEFLTGNVIDYQDASTDSAESDKIFEIASITKTFSAATMVRLACNEDYEQFFDAQDPMGTKIATFENLLKEESHRIFFQELKDNHPNYQEISIRNILNHTSGIVDDT